MSDAPERIAFRWEVGAAITSGPLMNHPDYVHYVRADRIEELESKLAKAVEALTQLVIEYDEVDLAYDEPKSMTLAVNAARSITAELKGETDE